MKKKNSWWPSFVKTLLSFDWKITLLTFLFIFEFFVGWFGFVFDFKLLKKSERNWIENFSENFHLKLPLLNKCFVFGLTNQDNKVLAKRNGAQVRKLSYTQVFSKDFFSPSIYIKIRFSQLLSI